jgi:hypothetical protein
LSVGVKPPAQTTQIGAARGTATRMVEDVWVRPINTKAIVK